MSSVPQPPPWPVYSAEARRRLAEAVAEGAVFDYAGGHGPVLELEQLFSRTHAGWHCISLNSGTSALFAAYAALGLGPGDEVIVPNLTFLATVSPLLWLGATPVLCDSGDREPVVSADAIRRCLTPRTRAVCVTHLFGDPVELAAVADLCRRHDIRLLEDCSHAHASTTGGLPVGVAGDVAVFSVGASKMVSGGHGGLLLTPHDAVRDAALLIGHFKPRTRSDLIDQGLLRHAEFGLGGNLRMSPLAALLALDHAGRLADLSAAKTANVAVLDEAVAGHLVPVRATDGRANGTFFDIVYALPPDVPTDRRDRLVEDLVTAGVPARAPATRPLNRVLRAIAASGAQRPGELWRRLGALAASAPADEQVHNSTGQHDRMISFPSPLLYDPECGYAEKLASATRTVLRGVRT